MINSKDEAVQIAKKIIVGKASVDDYLDYTRYISMCCIDERVQGGSIFDQAAKELHKEFRKS